jgi:hypothetical protein
MTKFKITLTLIVSLLTAITALAQDYSVEAKDHFSQFTDTKSQMELIKKSLPSLAQCKLIFKKKSAYTYFGWVEDMKSTINTTPEKNKTFEACRIESFTTYDIQQGKGNYGGGMEGIQDQIQTNVTFYKVTYLREKNAEFGLSYRYFVNIKGNWVFIPKPWRALK